VPLEALILAGVAAFVVLVAAVPVIVHHRRRDRFIREKLERAKRLGTSETLSLHPVVDEGKCIGCEECVRGCPEQDVLALYRHKAVVIDAVECVGHGICERVCPVDAIALVVGTETRGLEIPKLTENFETNVPGLYVVGELGGMGLIRNAIWQAAQAVEHIRRRPRPAPSGGVEVLVVGAGPAGLAAALAARESRLSCRIIDQETLGGSMLHYPRRKLVMTHPGSLPGVGEFPFREIEKEPLLAFWRTTAERAEIAVEEGVMLQSVERADGLLVARTSAGSIRAGRVILALGRRGTPRKLEVPGEESAKVMYRLIEAHRLDGQRALVAGGGSAAIETALALAERPGSVVTLCHRRDTFSGRAALIEKLLGAERTGRLEVLRNARVTAIEPDRVTLDVAGAPAERPNDAVFVMIGGVPPYQILRDSGVNLETKFGTPLIVRR
jgi:thioredoxin reductase/ferredoxin